MTTDSIDNKRPRPASNGMKTTIVTHNGSFHADDVFAVATIILSLPPDSKYTIIRTRDIEEISKADYVVDVGGVYDVDKKRFDHHQEGGAGKRQNGIPYASFGLVWKEYGAQVSGNVDVAKIIEEKLVMFIDALDNGVEISNTIFEDIRPYTISDYLYSYWIDQNISDKEVDVIFHRVVSMAKDLIIREKQKISKIIEEGQIVEDIYNKSENKKIIVLDKHLAWGRKMAEKPEPLFVVYPSLNQGLWNVKAVRTNINSFEIRASFPASWSGKTMEDLSEVSGIKGAFFCHKNLFLAVADSKEGAIALAKKALEN